MSIREFLARKAGEREAEWRSHMKPAAIALIERGNVTNEERKAFVGNSYEWERMIPVLDDEAFLASLAHVQANVQFDQRRPCASYNESLALLYVPELVKRYTALLRRLEGIEHANATDPK